MKSCSFQIKIALLGHVSVGKTTLLNALLGDKFSEVSKRRTTAGIDHFHIVSLPRKEADTDSQDTKPDTDGLFMKSSDTLATISKDNKSLRENAKIKEKTFIVELDDPIIQMMDNCDLVVTDVPGLNEAGTKDMYLNFVEKAWDTFDLAVVVMDAAQGVNTEEQVKLLKFVKKNLKEKRDIPVIILCNKVDDPSDKELMELVEEVQKEVEKIFSVSDRKKALESMLQSSLDSKWQIVQEHRSKRQKSTVLTMSPLFIPMSAENAFLYRSASQLSRDELHKLDEMYLDKIGQEEVGRFKWNRLSNEQKVNIVADVVNDTKQYEERLASSNFDKFASAIQYLLSGEEKQKSILELQLKVQLKKLSSDEGFSEGVLRVYERSSFLGKSVSHLYQEFWNFYNECEENAFAAFEEDQSKLHMLYVPMKELKSYESRLFPRMCSTDKKDLEKAKISESMKSLVIKFIETISNKFNRCQFFQPKSNDPWTHQIGYNGWRNSKTSEKNYNSREFHPEGYGADQYRQYWEWNEEAQVWKNKYTKNTREGTRDTHPFDAPPTSWSFLYCKEWSYIIDSILVLKHDEKFYGTFSKQIFDLKWCSKRPVEQKDYINTCRLPMSAGPADESHWGHLIWLYYFSIGGARKNSEAIILLENYDGEGTFNSVMSKATEDIGYIRSAEERDVVHFYKKRIPCSCLDELYSEIKKSQVRRSQCYYCKQTVKRKDIKTCSRCNFAHYCSKECQISDWASHKEDCAAVVRLHESVKKVETTRGKKE